MALLTESLDSSHLSPASLSVEPASSMLALKMCSRRRVASLDRAEAVGRCDEFGKVLGRQLGVERLVTLLASVRVTWTPGPTAGMIAVVRAAAESTVPAAALSSLLRMHALASMSAAAAVSDFPNFQVLFSMVIARSRWVSGLKRRAYAGTIANREFARVAGPDSRSYCYALSPLKAEFPPRWTYARLEHRRDCSRSCEPSVRTSPNGGRQHSAVATDDGIGGHQHPAWHAIPSGWAAARGTRHDRDGRSVAAAHVLHGCRERRVVSHDRRGGSWVPITDGKVPVASTGAVAVAESDPNVMR